MMHPQWQENGSKVTLSGCLDRDSVPQLWHSLQQWHPKSGNIECSLQELQRVDSAGMAMLLHLIEHAKKQNCHIMFSFVPEQLSTLFTLSNVDSIVAEHIKG